MSKFSSQNYKKISKRLKELGCHLKQDGGRKGGSHETRYSPYIDDYFIVVNHGSKTTPKGTFRYMLKNAGITKDMYFS